MLNVVRRLKLNDWGANAAGLVLIALWFGANQAPEPWASLFTEWGADVVPLAGGIGLLFANMFRSSEQKR